MPDEKKHACLLIVDDVLDNIILLDGILKGRYQVKAANSGEKALKLAAEAPRPDLIILDIMMPGMDGFEVIRRLKATPTLATIPVICLTAKNSVEDETTGLELGAVDFISKPINPPIVLARVRTHLIAKQALDLLRERNGLLEQSLSTAARIQEKLLPRQELPSPRLKFAWKFQPSETVGGDLFNFLPLGKDHIGIFMLDVEGHGLPAAMITFSISQVMQPLSATLGQQGPSDYEFVRPGKVLQRLTEVFTHDRFQTCFTMAYLVIDTRTGRLISSSGGHPRPLILRKDGTLVSLDAGGPLLGFMESEFDDQEDQLLPGDKLFLYTDGLTDLHNSDNQQFDLTRLVSLLKRNAAHPVQIITDRIEDALREFAGKKKPADDITLLGVEFLLNSESLTP